MKASFGSVLGWRPIAIIVKINKSPTTERITRTATLFPADSKSTHFRSMPNTMTKIPEREQLQKCKIAAFDKVAFFISFQTFQIKVKPYTINANFRSLISRCLDAIRQCRKNTLSLSTRTVLLITSFFFFGFIYFTLRSNFSLSRNCVSHKLFFN